jgi:hypothetical protein
MSGSAKAGTTAERHACELRVLPEFAVRAPPKRASGESFSPLTKDLHGSRQSGSCPGMASRKLDLLVTISRLLDTDFRIGEHSNNLHLQNRFSVLSSEFAHADELAGAVLGE